MKESELPKVCIIMPTYNNVEYIEDAIDSVLDQSYGNYEIIIVDDGSTDNTSDFIEHKYKGNKYIKYFYKSNGGVSSARNFGITHSDGEYVAFLDSDDAYERRKINIQLEYLLNNPDCGMVYSNMYLFNEHGIICDSYHAKHKMKCSSGNIFNELVLDHVIGMGTVMIRRRIFEDVGLFDTELETAEDYDLWLRIASRFRIDYINEVLFGYRRGHESLTNNKLVGQSEYTEPNSIKVLKKHLAENGHILSIKQSQINNRFFKLYFDYAWSAYHNKNYILSRAFFIRSLRYKVFHLKTFCYIVITFFKNRG